MLRDGRRSMRDGDALVMEGSSAILAEPLSLLRRSREVGGDMKGCLGNALCIATFRGSV